MIKYFQEKYALSEKGAKDLVKAIFWSALVNLSYMIPIMLIVAVIDHYIGVNSIGRSLSIGIVLLISLAIIIFMYLLQLIHYETAYGTIYEESAKARIDLAETIRKLPLAFFGKKDVSDLSATMMEDATFVETLFSHAVPQLYASIITMFLIGCMLLSYNLTMGIAVLWVVPISYLILVLSYQKREKSLESHYAKSRKNIDIMQENIENIQEIKAYSKEESANKKLNDSLDEYENELIKVELLNSSFLNFSYVPLKLGLPSVAIAGGFAFLQNEISVFTYIVFIVVASRIYMPLMEVANFSAMLQLMGVRINRRKEMHKMPRQVGKTEFKPKDYNIEFKNVNFSYNDGEDTIKNMSFIAKQGDVTALVGPSGGGKSTVAKLSARFWDIQSGEITLGGEDISKIDPETLLESYSIVFQDVTLFNNTIMENIRIGRKEATDEEVIAAGKLAQCDEFVNQLAEGYKTEIGENGEKLSGGERQRISIARAILKNAPIILMDEATASLDTENESKVQRALNSLIENKTVIIIAHRMRTVINADKIIVIKDGNVAEQGAPKELIDKNGVFAEMIKSK